MTRTSIAGCLAICLAAAPIPRVSHQPAPALGFGVRLRIQPNGAQVFTGATLRFRVSIVGATAPLEPHWTLVGDGALSADGTYVAPPRPAQAVIAVAAGGSAASTSVRVVNPPAPMTELALVTCYDEGDAQALASPDLLERGRLHVGAKAAGIAVDPDQRVALVATEGRVVSIDLSRMRAVQSEAIAGARFSEVALLADGYFAATDNNAADGGTGVRIFALGPNFKPLLVGGAPAGETPEGIAAASDGREFYVTNINGNSLMRFSFDGRGHARLVARAATGARPFGLALDARHALVFVADNDTSVVSGPRSRPGLETFSLRSLRRVRPPLATGTPNSLPLGVAVDGDAGRLFVTNEGDADVAVYSLPTLQRVAALPVGRSPWLPALDTRRHLLYVPAARSDALAVYDTRSLRQVATASTCGYPTGVALAPGTAAARVTLRQRRPAPHPHDKGRIGNHACTVCNQTRWRRAARQPRVR